MDRRTKIYFLIGLTVVVGGGIIGWGAIPQEQVYHNFCDGRSLWGIPNFANVASNLAFCAVGAAGLIRVRISEASERVKLIYAVVFSGVFLTGIGSGYYHYRPDDPTLVFDRLPMTIVFMGMTAAAMEEGIGPGIGSAALWPLFAAGLISVAWWHYTGDLRLYVLIQYYPIILIPAVLLLFSNAMIHRGWTTLILCFALYALSKITEALDCRIYAFLGGISGHTIKHLLAALATGSLVVRFRIMHGDQGWLIWFPKE
jgi:hypothetical protein